MLKLTDKRFSDYFSHQAETGMGYWTATTHLKNGSSFPQTVVVGGVIARVRHCDAIPFVEEDIDHFEVTHDKWDWR
jgi:hypothetical protein